MVRQSFRYLLAYIRLFWAIAWRTFTLSIATAILSGIGLGVLMTVKQYPPAFIEIYTPMIGLPITLLTGAYIVWRQSMKFANTAVAA